VVLLDRVSLDGAIAAVVLLLAIVVLRRRPLPRTRTRSTVMSADGAGTAVSMDDAYPPRTARSSVL
jgi:hypothetical protein